MSITLKEVAKLAGVSPSTVSRTLSDHPSISTKTKEKIRRIMQEAGYEGTNEPVTVRDAKTIAVVLPISEVDTFENSFFLQMLRGVSLFLNKKQYSTVLITGSTHEEVISAIRNLDSDNKLGGVILLYSVEQDPVLDYLFDEGILYVLIGKVRKNINDTLYVDNDNISAGREATDYLIELGHRKIGYVGSSDNKIFASDRKSGYMLSLAEHGLPINPDYCCELAIVPKDKMDDLTHLLSMEDRPTALVVSDDILALSIEKAAYNLKLRIPEDLSIVSFNNSILAKITNPQLTSIDVNSQQLGFEAASQMINHIENPSLLATKILVPHFLVERGSCAAIEE